jgi:hypothetical protein
MNNKEVDSQQRFLPKSLQQLWLVFTLCLVILLTGCVRYDVGINFTSQNGGTIVQHIKLGEQLTSLNQTETNNWLNSIEQRSRSLQGKVKRINPQELEVTIPFSNGKELVTKFNQFFHSSANDTAQFSQDESLDLLQLDSQMSLHQSNLLLFERDRLTLTVDLRSLAILANQDRIVVNPSSLIDLKFQINTPWLARSVVADNILNLTNNSETHQLIWQLQPGQLNYIETVFWLPSPLGIGSALIILLILGGFYLKYRRFPGINSLKTT